VKTSSIVSSSLSIFPVGTEILTGVTEKEWQRVNHHGQVANSQVSHALVCRNWVSVTEEVIRSQQKTKGKDQEKERCMSPEQSDHLF